VIFAIVFAVGCQGGGSSATPPTGSVGTETTPGELTQTEESVSTSEAQPAFVVQGRGKTKRSITVPQDFSPLILSAAFPERVILTISLRGKGLRRPEGQSGAFLFDTPEPGATAMPGIAHGRYSLQVRGTNGRWTLRFSEPNPSVSPADLLGDVISGDGDAVRAVHLDRETGLEWEMQTDGPFLQGNLLGYDEADGVEEFLGILQGGFLFEPGNSGLRTEQALPAGKYLLVVEADGAWDFAFNPSE
jgi:hypothetical protein